MSLRFGGPAEMWRIAAERLLASPPRDRRTAPALGRTIWTPPLPTFDQRRPGRLVLDPSCLRASAPVRHLVQPPSGNVVGCGHPANRLRPADTAGHQPPDLLEGPSRSGTGSVRALDTRVTSPSGSVGPVDGCLLEAPRHTSSCSLVSSRTTTTRRRPPAWRRGPPRSAPIRRGLEKMTDVRCSTGQSLEHRGAPATRAGEKSLENEPIGGETGNGQRCGHRAGTGDGGDRGSCFEGRLSPRSTPGRRQRASPHR